MSYDPNRCPDGHDLVHLGDSYAICVQGDAPGLWRNEVVPHQPWTPNPLRHWVVMVSDPMVRELARHYAAAVKTTLYRDLEHEVAILRPERGDLLVVYLEDDRPDVTRTAYESLQALGVTRLCRVALAKHGDRLELVPAKRLRAVLGCRCGAI